MLELMRSQAILLAGVYFVSSFACGIVAVSLGTMLGMKKREDLK